MKMRVLIVEDEIGIHRLLQVYLGPYANCDQALDGGEGWTQFTEHLAAGMNYDLVILDIMMPVLDGQKLLEKIRALEKAKGITRLEGVKIIMLTALDGTPTVVGSFKSGCDAYLPKPFEEEDLLREIRDLKLI
jgi:two-component system chemotaxis response regulator CheY